MVSTYNSYNCRCEPVCGVVSLSSEGRFFRADQRQTWLQAVRSCLFRRCCCSVLRHIIGTIPDLAIVCRTQHNLCSELKPGLQSSQVQQQVCSFIKMPSSCRKTKTTSGVCGGFFFCRSQLAHCVRLTESTAATAEVCQLGESRCVNHLQQTIRAEHSSLLRRRH